MCYREKSYCSAPGFNARTDAAGIAAISKGIMNFIGFSSRFSLVFVQFP